MKKPLLIMIFVLAMSAPAWAADYKPVVVAHRGASGYLPEHTLEAKALAHGLNADYLEQDVVFTSDNVLVVLHDHTLETTTNVAEKFPGRQRKDGSYYAIDFTFDEIRSLAVTERFQPNTGQAVFEGRFPVDSGLNFTVPTLEEEIKFIAGLNKATGKNVGLYVEIKEPAFHEREGKDITRATIDLLTQYGYNQKDANIILQIFDYDAVKKSRDLGWLAPLAMLVDLEGQLLTNDTDIHKWLITKEGIEEVAKYADIYAPWFGYMAVATEGGKGYSIEPFYQWAREAGMQVHTWTHRSDALTAGFPTEEAMFDTIFQEMKLDGLFSDFPDRPLAYLKTKGLR